MSKPLLIINGPKDVDISRYGEALVYKLSTCKIRSKFKFYLLNDPKKLDKYADLERNDYINWIYSIGNLPIYKRFKKIINFNLFHFGDIPSIRNEIYPTFNIICNIRLIQEILKINNPSYVKLINLTIEYYSIFRFI